jgi:hypothetical protein
MDIEHTFIKKKIANSHQHRLSSNNGCQTTTTTTSLKCDNCQLKIKSDEFYYECKDCHTSVHLKCAKSMKRNCKIAPLDANNDNDEDEDVEVLMDEQTTSRNSMEMEARAEATWSNILKPGGGGERQMSVEEEAASSNPNGSDNGHHEVVKMQMSNEEPEEPSPLTPTTPKELKRDLNDVEEILDDADASSSTALATTTQTAPSRYYKHGANRIIKKKNQIGLQRLSQRVEKTSDYFWSGHMYYSTNLAPEPATHYWRLDATSITIYDSYRLKTELKKLLLVDIRRANLCGISAINNYEELSNEQKCLFILTTEHEIFYCGMGNTDQNSTMNVLARNFYNIFKMVFLPYGNRNGS